MYFKNVSINLSVRAEFDQTILNSVWKYIIIMELGKGINYKFIPDFFE